MMMKTLATALLFTASCLSVSAFAACEQPSMVTIPDGKTATMDELLTVQTGVKAYMAEMEEYLACVNEELEAGGDDAPAQFKALMVTRHNAAVTEMETVAATFNEQVAAYKAANETPSE